ncbi:FAD-dependent monooxygenase [Orrella marina]|uniref:Ubiquinone biosynthesis protein UbiH n=1 Tax=Orrella marina TaxID=2163011 RepID=A0A2R4XL49_9BURK|nr:FAD-dependent monooxygenase [Orrella marina]AWB34530.1 ubiquinone biosynthesis protein UbiH [Orrella marina]
MKTQSVVVCGAGIVGMALALDFARRGVRDVVLLGPPPRVAELGPDDYHLRVYAISAASQAYLQTLGVWALLPENRVTRVQAMEVRGDAFGAIYLRAWQAAQNDLTWIVESAQIEHVLAQALRVYGVQWIQDTLTDFREETGVTASGQSLKASLWVAADGTESTLRARSGIRFDVRDYDSMGVVGHLTCERPHQGVAFQWFQDKGILALLPLPDTSRGHQVSMVWSIRKELARPLLDMPIESQQNMLAERLGKLSRGRLGKLRLHTPIRGFDLLLAQSDMIGQRVALVGDAAHRVHPLAGQGLNLGLADARDLARIMVEREPFLAMGDQTLLRRYRRARAQELLEMRLVTDGLKRLFDLDLPGAVWVRNAGMSLLDRLPPAKRVLVEAATRLSRQA